MSTIPIVRQGAVGRMADWLMTPVMYALQGNFSEQPQRTHRWNNQHLCNFDISHLRAHDIVIVEGDIGANKRWLGPLPLFHMPVFGGWSKFVVLEPSIPVTEWYVGWVAFDALGVSMIPLNGPVRLGIGPRQAQFFALNANGEQLPLAVIGEGRVGQAGQFKDVPFL